MRLHVIAGLLLAVQALLATPLAAQMLGTPAPQAEDKYHVTSQEKAACSSDAIRLCMHTYPDEDRLLVCMKQNRDALSAACRVAFDAGVRRRRL